MVAPITRAIRHALAVSATMLALAEPATALAQGVCGPVARNEWTRCTGQQTHADTTAGASADPFDLTRVADAAPPGSVHVADGFAAVGNGVSASGIEAIYATVAVLDTGIEVTGIDIASLENADAVGASASATGIDDASAYGAIGVSDHFSTLTNTSDGRISALASAQDGNALAVGAYAGGGDVATLDNAGDIVADATSITGDARAYGGAVYAGGAGIGLLVNGGSLDAEATVGAGGTAYATGAYVGGNVASIFNDGSTHAAASAGADGMAVARGAYATGMYSAVSNYGDLGASADADGGVADATGAQSVGYYGSAAYNAGAIQATATAHGGEATAVGSYSKGMVFSADTTNAGSIAAAAVGDAADARGVVNIAAYLGNATTTNDGSISAVAEGGIAPYGETEAVAFGVYNFAAIYDSVVDNSGSISATATANAVIDTGYLQAKAIGVGAMNLYGYGDTGITNTGDISAVAETAHRGYALAWGAVVQSSGRYGGDSWVDNDGSITAGAHTDLGLAKAYGAYVINLFDGVGVVNHGDIVAVAQADDAKVAYAYATSVRVGSVYGAVSVGNDANLAAHASTYGGIAGARGIQATGDVITVANAAGGKITATGEAGYFGGGFATGIEANGTHGIDVDNAGDIVVYGHAHGHVVGDETHYGVSNVLGIYAAAGIQGNVSVANSGDITATAISEDSITFFNGGASATGISTYAKYDGSVVNAGDITATADSELGIALAYGVVVHDKYHGNFVNEAGASIFASATVGSLDSDQYGGRAFAAGARIFGGTDDAFIDNAGSIVAHAVVTADGGPNPGRSIATAFGSSIGYSSDVLRGTMDNAGSIEAAASADFGYATAYGTFVRVDDVAATSNAGDIRAMASAAEGDAFAVGSYAFARHASVHYNCDANGCDYAHPVITVIGGAATIDNGGDILVGASADGGVGHAYGAAALGAFSAGITNAGHITAVTQADQAVASGGIANSEYGDALLANSGAISASASGDSADAFGVSVLGAHGNAANGYLAAVLDNQGSIVARAEGGTATATGVELVGAHDDGVRVGNAGSILAGAYGADATAIAVSMESAGNNMLVNTGTIGAFGDGLRIAVWSGDGATATISNAGSILGAIRTGDLDDSLDNARGGVWHALGTSDFGAGDDHVANRGTIVMDNATIALGGAVNGNVFHNAGTLGVAGAHNRLDMGGAFAANNDGTISFVDGAADDVLTLLGDLAGTGALDVDVSGQGAASDRFFVDGNVLGSAVQAVNVNLLDLPGAAAVQIPVLDATGALDGSFALGSVQYARDGFVSLDFHLGQSANQVWLGVDVTGLNGAGALASNLAPGVQSLVNAQVGTWRQRMGLVPNPSQAGLSPWMRAVADSGDVDPDHVADFGPGGSLGFHQSNNGLELGLEARPTAHLAVGALIAKSEGNQHIDGAGSDKLDGRTFGLYATWLADNGFYLDVSQRWMGVDARVHAEASFAATSEAQALNVEAGYTAWTSAGGLHLVPQLQLTRTRVADVDGLDNAHADFVTDGGVSSRARVGIAFDRTFQGKGFTWTPFGSVNAVHEFDGEYDYTINGGLHGSTRTDGTSAMVEVGLGARRGALSLTGGVNWSDGGALDGVAGGQLTVRYGW